MRLRVSTTAGPFEWETAELQFRLGRGEGCALRFEGEAGKGVSWEHAAIEQQADGRAVITDLRSSNGTYVDGSRIEAAAPLRVGTIIQLGRTGPRIEVLQLTVSAARPLPVSPTPAAAAIEPRRAANVKPRRTMTGSELGITVVLALAGVGAVAGYLMSAGRVQPAGEGAAANASTDSRAAPPVTKVEAKQTEVRPADGKAVAGSGVVDAAPMDTTTARPAATDPWQKLLDQLRPGIQLVVVEDPKTHATWPFATVAVVGPKECLTTAGVAIDLAKFRSRGWNVSIRRNSQQPGLAVSDIRIHAFYEQAKPEEQLYFDAALLLTDTASPQPQPLSIPTKMAVVEVGQRVACITIDHEREPIDRFQRLEPRAEAGKIFAVTSLPPQPGGPRLLHLRGTFSDNARGSPVVNDRGELLALYCEPAPAAASGQKDLHIHYAQVIEPELIALASDSSNKVWVHPAANTSNPGKARP